MINRILCLGFYEFLYNIKFSVIPVHLLSIIRYKYRLTFLYRLSIFDKVEIVIFKIMKNLYLVILSIFVSHSTNAQTDCFSGRYYNQQFEVNLTEDIVYGNNVNAWGSPEDLKFDVYEPAGDTLSLRPFILLAHGGEFIEGTKKDSDMVVLSRNLCKTGYVVASIDYRKLLTFFSLDGYSAKRAAYGACQDMRAAIRYFRKDVEENNNTFRIDTTQFYIGGTSAGAITALHVAFMDKYSEVLPDIDTTGYGTIEGNSGNPGYIQSIKGVINLSGALLHAEYIESGDNIPIISMHGSVDDVVPYGKAASALISDLELEGSYEIERRCTQINEPSFTYSFWGQNHIPYFQDNDTTAYIDTVCNFVKNRMYEQLGCTCSNPEPLPNTVIDTSENIALYKPVYADDVQQGNEAEKAVDGLTDTRFSTNFSDSHVFVVDLLNNYNISKFKILWEYAHGESYRILCSPDSLNWDTIVTENQSDGGTDLWTVSCPGRYVKIDLLHRFTEYGFSFWEFEVYGTLSGNAYVVDEAICEAEAPYYFGSLELTESGSYTQTFETATELDSVVTLNLTVNPSYDKDTNITICESELPYQLGSTEITAPGTYTENFNTMFQCDSVVTINISINPTVNVNIFDTICESNLPYQFGSQELISSGTYTENFTTILQCDSTVNLSLEVVNTPQTPVITQVGDSLFSDAVAGNQWYLNNNPIPGATGNAILITEPGEYFAVVTEENDCNSDESNHINIESTSILRQTDTVIYIYPNPASSYINIEGVTGFIEIFDITGKSVFQKEVFEGLNQIEIASLTPGLYFIEINKNTQKLRLIIE